NHASGSAGRVHPDDPTGPHDLVDTDPASVTGDSAQHVHGEDSNSIDVQDRHDHHQSHDHEHSRGHAHDHDHGHQQPTGMRAFFYGFFLAPTHVAAAPLDDAGGARPPRHPPGKKQP